MSISACNYDFRGSIDLQAACAGFIFQNFKDICTREELKPEELKALLSHRSASRTKESVVVDAVITWLNKAWARNFNEAPGVIAEINWSELRGSELAKIKSVKEFAKIKCTSAEQKAIKLEIVELLLNPRRDSAEKEPSKIVAISETGRTEYRYRYSVSEYSLTDREWTSWLPVGEGDGGTMAFAFQGCVVLIFRSVRRSDSVKAHVLKQGRIHARIPLVIPGDYAWHLHSVTFSKPFLCLTCFDEQYRTTKIILYDFRQLLPAQEEVSDIPAILVHRTIDVTADAHAMWSKAVYCQDEVHLLGGIDCNEMSVFSLSSNAWRLVPSSHEKCCNDRAYRFVVDGVLYSVGGDTNCECNNTFERFDPVFAAEGWVKGPDLVQGCQVWSHYVRDGRLFVGGQNEKRGPHLVQSIHLNDFPAGWRDESAFLADLNARDGEVTYTFAV